MFYLTGDDVKIIVCSHFLIISYIIVGNNKSEITYLDFLWRIFVNLGLDFWRNL